MTRRSDRGYAAVRFQFAASATTGRAILQRGLARAGYHFVLKCRAYDAVDVSPLSLRGAFIFIALGVVLLWFLYKL